VFEVKNEQGKVIGNQDMVTLGLRQTWSATCNLRAFNGAEAIQSGAAQIRSQVNNAWYSTFSLPGGAEDFLAFRPTNGKPVGIGFMPNGGRCFVGESTDNVPPTLDWWLFSPRGGPREHGFGIEIKRADQSIAFSNMDNPMEIVAITVDGSGGSVYANAPGDYAVCPGIPVVRPITYNYDQATGKFYVVEQAFMFEPYGNGFTGAARNSQIQSSSDTNQFNAPYANKCTTFLVNVGKLANAIIQ